MNHSSYSGTGLPPVEQAFLSASLKLGCSLMSDARALQFFLKEAGDIIDLVDDVDYDFASQSLQRLPAPIKHHAVS